MKTSSRTTMIIIATVVALLLVCLFTMQAVAPEGSSVDEGGLLIVTVQPTSAGTSAPVGTSLPEVPMGLERQVGDLRIMVIQVIRPADDRLGPDLAYLGLLPSEEVIFVDVRVGCIPLKSDCPVDLKDFGLRSSLGDWGDLIGPIRVPNVRGLFTTGVIPGNKTLEGGLLYRIKKSARGLVMYYPLSAGQGTAARFTVTQD
jgi:hypothetical protein